MGQASLKTDHLSSRKRPGKTLRTSAAAISNLAVFKEKSISATQPSIETEEAQSIVTTPQKPDLSFGTSSQGVEEPPSLPPARPEPKKSAAPPLAFSKAAPKGLPKNIAKSLSTGLPKSLPKNTLSLAIISSLAVGTVVGTLLTMPEQQSDSAEPVATQDTQSQDVPSIEPITGIASASVPLTAPVPDKSMTSVQVAEEMAARYLEEIQWLRTQNSALLLEVNSLTEETISLNQELLNLELQVATLESQAKPTVETRVVYNFVDVPIGSAIGSESYASNTQSSQDNTIAESDYATTDDYQDDDFNEQYLPQSDDGTYQAPDMNSEYAIPALSDSDYPMDSEVAYDPETGFYINSQYFTEEQIYATEAELRLSYPPIQRNN